MTLPLRERRRLETAREIQRTTLDLARTQGFENVTTEAIAEAVGISTRTFFNYYTNKEAASVGLPPVFSDEDKVALRDGTAPLVEDLHRFLISHMEQLARSGDIIRGLAVVIGESARVRSLLDQHLTTLNADLTACLSARLPGDRGELAETLADWCLYSIRRAIEAWQDGNGDSLPDTMDRILSRQMAAARLIFGDHLPQTG